MVRSICLLITLTCMSCSEKSAQNTSSISFYEKLRSFITGSSQSEIDEKKKQKLMEIDAEIYTLIQEQERLEKILRDPSSSK